MSTPTRANAASQHGMAERHVTPHLPYLASTQRKRPDIQGALISSGLVRPTVSQLEAPPLNDNVTLIFKPALSQILRA